MVDNTASALSFDASGKTGILEIDTRNGAERVTMSGGLVITGDLTVTGDDITMNTNTDTAIMVADGTNFNPVVPSGVIDLANDGAFTVDNTFISSQTEISSGLAAADELLYSDAGTVKKVGLDTLTTYLAGVNAGTVTSTGISDSSGVLTLDIQNMTASTGVADADLIVIDDGAGGTLRKMTRANFIESAALDSIDIDGGAIDGTVIGANAAANVTAAALVSTTFAPSDDVTIADGKGIIIESEPADDAYTGIYGNFANATGSTITKGQVVYMTGTANQVAPAQSNATGTMPAVAMAIADVANGATGNFLMYGFAHDASAFIALTIGGEAYVSDTAAGALDATAPADTGEFVQIIGVGMHGDKLFFNPQLPMVKVA